MKTPQNAPFCIKSANKIILGGKPHQTPPPPLSFPGLVACTAKKASYAPAYHILNCWYNVVPLSLNVKSILIDWKINQSLKSVEKENLHCIIIWAIYCLYDKCFFSSLLCRRLYFPYCSDSFDVCYNLELSSLYKYNWFRCTLILLLITGDLP